MRSNTSSALNLHCFSCVGVFLSSKPSSRSLTRISLNPLFRRRSATGGLKLSGSGVRRNGSRRRICEVRSMDEGSFSFDDWEDNAGVVEHVLSSSEGEESDGEVMLNTLHDAELPTARNRFLPTNDVLTVTTHRLAMLRRGRRKDRIKYGVMLNVGLVTFSTLLVLCVDWCAWRIVRLPLQTFYLMRPFCISAVLVSCAGYVCVPLLRSFNIRSVIKKKEPLRHSSKKGTPTIGGLYFIPIGIIVAEVLVGFSSIEISGAAAVTLVFAAIGLLDDTLTLVKNDDGALSAWLRNLFQVAAGSCFSLWLNNTRISTPYSMKFLVPLPPPLGLLCLGKGYLLLTSFCFVSMANGTDVTDGLDGLSGGTAALAFIGMSIAVLPICADLAVFGASMAGACIGFLSHNRFKASVFMGNTGSLALGGALAAMGSLTGMFLPLFISSGIFILELVSVLMQVTYFKTTKRLWGTGRRLFRMAPLHNHLDVCGVKEPIIVAGGYVISCVLALYAGYVGLVSA